MVSVPGVDRHGRRAVTRGRGTAQGAAEARPCCVSSGWRRSDAVACSHERQPQQDDGCTVRRGASGRIRLGKVDIATSRSTGSHHHAAPLDLITTSPSPHPRLSRPETKLAMLSFQLLGPVVDPATLGEPVALRGPKQHGTPRNAPARRGLRRLTRPAHRRPLGLPPPRLGVEHALDAQVSALRRTLAAAGGPHLATQGPRLPAAPPIPTPSTSRASTPWSHRVDGCAPPATRRRLRAALAEALEPLDRTGPRRRPGIAVCASRGRRARPAPGRCPRGARRGRPGPRTGLRTRG